METLNNVTTMAESAEAPRLQYRASYNVDDETGPQRDVQMEESKSHVFKTPNKNNESDMVVYHDGKGSVLQPRG